MVISFSELGFGEQCMNLAMTNPMQVLGLSATFGFGHQVVRVFLRFGDRPVAERTNGRFGMDICRRHSFKQFPSDAPLHFKNPMR